MELVPWRDVSPDCGRRGWLVCGSCVVDEWVILFVRLFVGECVLIDFGNLADKSTACCDHHHTPNTATQESSGSGRKAPSTPLLYCFSSLSARGSSDERCLDPILVLTNLYPGVDLRIQGDTRGQARCSLATPCRADDECVRLREDEQILRITFRDDQRGSGREEVLLWSGPRVEVLEQGVCTALLVGRLRETDFFYK